MSEWLLFALIVAAEVGTPLALAFTILFLTRWSIKKDRTITVMTSEPHMVGSLISVANEGVFEVKSVKGGGPYTMELRKAE